MDGYPHAPQLRPPPRLWPVFAAYAVVVAGIVLVPGAMLAALAVARDPTLASRPAELERAVENLAYSISGLTLVVLVNSSILLGTAVAAASLSPRPWRRRLALETRGASPGLTLVLAVGALGLSQALDSVVVLLGLEKQGFLPRFRQVAAGASGPALAWLTAIMALAPALGEEIFFRGYLQTRLAARLAPAAAVALTALLFGLLHLDPVQGPMAAVLGLYLGHIALVTGSTWPAIVAHAANNAVAVLGAALLPALGGRVLSAALLPVGLAVAGASLWQLHRRLPARGGT